MKTKKSECLAAVNLDWPDSTDNIALNALTVNNDDDNQHDDKDNHGKDNHGDCDDNKDNENYRVSIWPVY